jgi:hypothetical protein
MMRSYTRDQTATRRGWKPSGVAVDLTASTACQHRGRFPARILQQLRLNSDRSHEAAAGNACPRHRIRYRESYFPMIVISRHREGPTEFQRATYTRSIDAFITAICCLLLESESVHTIGVVFMAGGSRHSTPVERSVSVNQLISVTWAGNSHHAILR